MLFPLALFLFALMYLNPLFCFGLGARETEEPLRLYPWLIVVVETALLWVVFERLFAFICPWFPGMFLVFPAALYAGFGLEIAFLRFFPGFDPGSRFFRLGSGYVIASLASLLLTIRLASGFGEALLLSLAFSGGGLGAALAVRAIRERAFWETPPRSLRGDPLTLISMGLLSLVFSASALVIVEALIG
jgi:Na+-transporting NADH:ubiquinone oxidoreductase subunit NqrE